MSSAITLPVLVIVSLQKLGEFPQLHFLFVTLRPAPSPAPCQATSINHLSLGQEGAGVVVWVTAAWCGGGGWGEVDARGCLVLVRAL